MMEPKLPADCEYHLSQLFQTPELRTEIRAYLRHRLFTSIQNSSLGPSLARKDVQPISPKLQTLNLLVAEYLLRHRHHFTLSVFSCEVPSVSCLSPTLQDTLMGRNTSSLVPFCLEDLNDMIDTLGIPPKSSHGQELLSRYLKKDQPLLECLIRSLPELRPSEIPSVQLRDQSSNTAQDTHRETAQIESVAKQVYLDALAELKRLHQEELKFEQTKCTTELLEREQKLQQADIKHKDEEQRLRELVNSLQEQLVMAETTLAEVKAEKLTDTKRVDDERKKEESGKEALEHKLHLRQIKLSEEAHRLEREKLGLKKIKKKLQMKQRQLDEVAVAIAHSQAESKDQVDPDLVSALEIQLQIKEQEISEIKSDAQRLREENQMLRSLTEQQRTRIDNLNVRMAELVSELHHTRENLTVECTMPRWPSQQSRHRSSSSSDGSPTDDIVRDAKRRIKTLEEEFEAIGRYHKNFQVRQLNESLMSSVLGSSSGQLFPPQASPSRHLTTWTTEQQTAYLPQESLLNSKYEQMVPPPIPKLPKTNTSHSVSKEKAKIVIEVPKENSNAMLSHHLPTNDIVNDVSVTSNATQAVHIENLSTQIKVMTQSNKPSVTFEDTINDIGPMGDAEVLQKPEEPLVLPETDNLSVTTSGNVDVGAASKLNGKDDHHCNADSKPLEHPVVEEKTQGLSLQLKTDYRLVDPQVSSSSSSKHISAACTSPKPDEDNFWDL